MSKPITRIELTGFRGATSKFELDIDPSKSLTLLFGENGSGKSSILDAIDVVCNGGEGSLKDISLGQGAGKYLCTLGKAQSTVNMTVLSNTEQWTGTMSRNNVAVSGPDTKPTVEILRRGQILNLVLARPRQRYDALRKFIDIKVVEKSENALKQKIAEVQTEIDRLLETKVQQEDNLNQLWELENRPGPGQTSMEWAENRVNTGIDELKLRLDQLKRVVSVIEAVTAAQSEVTTKKATAEAREGELRAIHQQINEMPAIDAGTAISLIESLENAKTYIDVDTDLDKCPTCQRPIDRQELSRIVATQLGELSPLKTLNDQRQTAQSQLTTAESNLTTAKETLVTKLTLAQEATDGCGIEEVAALAITWPVENITPDLSVSSAVAQQLEDIRVTLTESRDAALRDVNQFNSVKQWHKSIKEAIERAGELDRICKGLNRAYEIVQENRKSFVQGILDDISNEANRLFQKIHPGENIGLEQLKMEESRGSSVNQAGQFHGHGDVPPQAVFSESHMDTLGFCVWLALAKRESPEETVILIDDIFSSVDASHLSRVLDLITAEGNSFLQVIVATHYRLCWTRSQNAQCIQRVQLGLWSIEHGIRAQNMPAVTLQLRQCLTEPVMDRQAVASKAGILLENVLDGLSLHYKRPIPRNRQNEYTLGDLMTACLKLFSTYNLTVQQNVNWQLDDGEEDWQSVDATGPFDRIRELQFIRNQVGCHFNVAGMEIPDNDIQAFGEATADLVDALTCSCCGMMATRAASDNSHLRCSCRAKTIRMKPISAS